VGKALGTGLRADPRHLVVTAADAGGRIAIDPGGRAAIDVDTARDGALILAVAVIPKEAAP
jgi:hypothetical protein